MMHRGREWMGDKYNDLLEAIRGANVKYADETSWRVEGKNYWVWACGDSSPTGMLTTQ